MGEVLIRCAYFLEVVSETVEELFLVRESLTAELTVAVFVIFTPRPTSEFIWVFSVMVTVAPTLSDPTSTVALEPDWIQLPTDEPQDTKLSVEGKMSITTTDVAVEGPLFVAVMFCG